MIEVAASNVVQLLEAAQSISAALGNIKPWWRGQADSRWDLVPSVHHKGVAANECNLTFRFKNMAKARYANCPSNVDYPGWLFLMQHYGLPTRLLDWTESLLVAAFFAIEDRDYDAEDGALWALNAPRLNREQGKEGVIYAADHHQVKPIFDEAFVSSAEPTGLILSVLTDQMDIRQLVQQSVFTIHGRNTPINELPGSDAFVAKIRIPQTAKDALRQVIDLLGVSRSGLFPDLQNLAVDLCGRGFTKQA